MTKYSYALLREIRTFIDDDTEIGYDTQIGSLLDNEKIDYLSWFLIVYELECIYGIEIPNDLLDERELTILDFGEVVSRLPKIPDYLYPEFLQLKKQILNCLIKMLEISEENDSDEQKEILEEQLDLLQRRLNEITRVQMN